MKNQSQSQKQNQNHSRSEAEKLYARLASSFAPKSLDEANRGVEFVAASENPVAVYDFERGPVKEILLIDGCEIPENDQVPLLDSHDRTSVDFQLGSMREFKKASPVLLGKAYFSKKQKAYDCFRDVAEGHITDCSVGYTVLEAIYCDPGQAITYNGRTYKADEESPLKLSTKWRLREVSITPVGADNKAKARAEDGISFLDVTEQRKREIPGAHRAEKNSGGSFKMNRKLYTLLISRGLAAGSTDEQAMAFLGALSLVDQQQLRAEAEKPEASVDIAKVEKEAMERAEASVLKRVTDIQEACRAAGVGEIESDLVKSCSSIDQARAKIIEELAKRRPAASVQIQAGMDESEKFNRAAVDGLQMQAGIRIANPAPGHESFRGRSLLRIAEMCLERSGVNTRNMSKSQLVQAALRMSERGTYVIAGSSADFTHILLDASNKSLLQGWNEGPRLWNLIARIGSAPDFKTINRIKLFEAPDLVAINENGEYTEAKFLDGQESYALTTKGLRFTISRKAIINDDLGAFTRIPRLLGNSATRAIEKAVFSLLTGGLVNTMHDTNAVFSAAHHNITTSAALSATAVQADIVAMATQHGQGADGASVPMGVIPKFLLVPWALKFTADIICNSAADPTASYSSGVVNPINTMGLQPLASPFLDLNDAKRRYLLADPNAYDTLEVSFLDGVQDPFMEEVDQTDADGRVFKVRLDVGAGVLDYPGILTNAGG